MAEKTEKNVYESFIDNVDLIIHQIEGSYSCKYRFVHKEKIYVRSLLRYSNLSENHMFFSILDSCEILKLVGLIQLMRLSINVTLAKGLSLRLKPLADVRLL